MTELPIACELTPEALAARRESLLADLVRCATRAEPTESGYRLMLPGDREALALAVAAIAAERDCCRFLRFVVTCEENLGPIVLEVSGPPGSRELLAGLLAPKAAV